MTAHARISAACADSPAKSQSDLLGQNIAPRTAQIIAFPGLTYAADRARFRDWFKAAFSRSLRDRFATHEQVAAAFGVRASTAWNWWVGDNRAAGDAVAYAFMMFPELRSEFVSRWEEK